MQNAGFFGKLLASILPFANEKTETREPDVTSSPTTQDSKESYMSSGVQTEFVSKPGTHFCPKCGWCDEIEVTMEKKTWIDSKGEKDTSYYFIKTDKKPECPKCLKRTLLPLTTGNVTIAVKYLLQSLQ